MTHYLITIKVSYDETTVPKDMASHLEDNVHRCVDGGMLFTDPELEAVVDEWEVAVTLRSERK